MVAHIKKKLIAKMAIGPRDLDLNLRLALPKGAELIKPDPYVRYSKFRLESSPCRAAQNRRVVG